MLYKIDKTELMKNDKHIYAFWYQARTSQLAIADETSGSHIICTTLLLRLGFERLSFERGLDLIKDRSIELVQAFT